MKELIKPLVNAIVSVESDLVAHVKVNQLKKGIYVCDLLDRDGKTLKENHEWRRGKQPFQDLTPDELKLLSPKKNSSTPADTDNTEVKSS